MVRRKNKKEFLKSEGSDTPPPIDRPTPAEVVCYRRNSGSGAQGKENNTVATPKYYLVHSPSTEKYSDLTLERPTKMTG